MDAMKNEELVWGDGEEIHPLVEDNCGLTSIASDLSVNFAPASYNIVQPEPAPLAMGLFNIKMAYGLEDDAEKVAPAAPDMHPQQEVIIEAENNPVEGLAPNDQIPAEANA